MLSPGDTAYPLLKASPSARELDELYTPTVFEMSFAERSTRQLGSRMGLLTLLKTFPKLGYFVQMAEVPPSIVRHVAKVAGYQENLKDLVAYDGSRTRSRHLALVRSYLGVAAFDRKARKLAVRSAIESARVREDLADVINATIEELVRQRYELPAFNTLYRAARAARATVNRSYYRQISDRLTDSQRQKIRSLLERDSGERRTGWDAVKIEPGQPTVKRIYAFLEHLDWLQDVAESPTALEGVPAVKLHRFAAEARVLNAARMQELMEVKQLAIAASLLHRQMNRAFDDAGDMFIRQVQKIHNSAKLLMQQKQAGYLQQSSELVSTLRGVAVAYSGDGSDADRLRSIGAFLEPDIQSLLSKCEEHVALVAGNHLQLLPRFFQHSRRALLLLLERVPITSTTQDRTLEQAIQFVLRHQRHRKEWLDLEGENAPVVDLCFLTEQWWPLVTGMKTKSHLPSRVHHRYLELCVISQVANELKSCDLCVPLGDKFRDYNQQLLPWPQFEEEVERYGEQTGIPVSPEEFVNALRQRLEQTARQTDTQMPSNEYMRIENGEPTLSPTRGRREPENLKAVEAWVKERMRHVDIVDALVDTEHWLNWARYFGPISGHDTKLDKPKERYVLTVFCYGCNLGPTQTARSVKGLDRFKLAFVNQRHITEANLNDAITTVINAYVEFPLQELWGSGKSASADGMKWDLYPQTLMSEYHIRYGGYGGIGYYLVSDNYIALMSRFTTCGSWEGHYILDFLQENKSDVQPDKLHADTQGQSTAIFGLAYLLGIELMPRIRNWKDQHLFRPSPQSRYQNIEELFTANVEWDLIGNMLPDMMRVAVSVKTGHLLPSDILRRLNSSSRKNKMYFAFRELGRVVRTMFLLRFISDVDLRRMIQAATNKSERFNQFVQWISFGGDSVIAENTRDEQRKFIKYNHLVANLLVFHNLVTLSSALERLRQAGLNASDDAIATLTPYQTEHINRFGNYIVNFNRAPEPLPTRFRKPAGIQEGQAAFDYASAG